MSQLASWIQSCPYPPLVYAAIFIQTIILAYAIHRYQTPKSQITPTSTPKTVKTILKVDTGNDNPPPSPTDRAMATANYVSSPAPLNSTPIQKRTFRPSVLLPPNYITAILSSHTPLAGYLSKKSSRGWTGSGWSRRWFVVKGCYLTYFNNESHSHLQGDSTPLCAIDIRHMSEIQYLHPKTINVVLSDGGVLRMEADTVTNAQLWFVNLSGRQTSLREGQIVADKEGGGGKEGGESLGFDGTITSKTLGSISEKEISCVRGMRGVFPNVDDAMLLRFARARKCDEGKAGEMLRTHLEWRRNTFPIRYEEVESQISKGKFVLRGRDREGDVVIYIFGRRLGPDTYVSLDEHMRSVFYLLERVCAEVLVDPMDKFTIVYNRVDVDNAKSDQDWVKAIAAALGNHYPERMKRCLVYPSNAVFRYIWKVIKIFFDSVTADKIQMIGKQAELEKFIANDELLEDVGGTDTYEYKGEHVNSKEMMSKEFMELKRVAPKAQIVYEF